MFCLLCRCHDTASPTNGDSTWNSKPCVRNITQAIKLHANSAMHEAAINKEHLQKTSPFHKEVQEREMVKNTVLLKVFTTLYWIAKEEIANTKATSLITLLERLGLQEIKHFQHRSQGSIREVFLFLEKLSKIKSLRLLHPQKYLAALQMRLQTYQYSNNLLSLRSMSTQVECPRKTFCTQSI